MERETLIDSEYFREYRKRLGFTNQSETKNFFGAKDIIPTVDINYIKLLNNRLADALVKVEKVVSEEIKCNNIVDFNNLHIEKTFEIIHSNNIFPALNNQGRRPENVYYSWLRGYAFANYFLKAIGLVFQTNLSNIKLIGDDDLKSVETFRRTPKADLQITLNSNEVIRIEVQSGFTGTNDIKQHKVLEAKRVFREIGQHTVAIHFDLYNGQVAFLELDKIEENNINWITRQQMEGQTVFNINQNFFVWKITNPPISFTEIDFNNLS